MTDAAGSHVGCVAIGRNEGERLRRCLRSLAAAGGPLVYVDSGSTDGSRDVARAAGAFVVELDTSVPFTAARGRNVGFERLLREAPGTRFVQFVDGDCELDGAWIGTGLRVLAEHDDVAVVCGRRRERAPEASVYNRLCDVEWDTPVGEARACGGDALVRVEAFLRAGGYDPHMIAGEEPDLCLRLRRMGYRILRLDAEMTLHDAAMTRWTQWWQRAVRAGHTSAELLWKYGATPEHGRLRRVLSALFWAVALPALCLALAVPAVAAVVSVPQAAGPVLLVAGYAVLLARVHHGCRRRGRSPADARAYALSCVLAKAPEIQGIVLYLARRVSRRTARWIEYKDGPRGLKVAAAPTSGPSVAPSVSPPPGPLRSRRVALRRRLRPSVDRTARWTGALARRERSSSSALTVLMYHRVLEDDACAHYPFPALAMPLRAFREQVRWLAARGTVLPLVQALQQHATDAGRDGPLYALTFDDGYEDSSTIVAGVLEDAGVRGTFFVTTGFVGSGQPLWFDRAALLFAGLPEHARRRAVLVSGTRLGLADLPPAGAEASAWTALLKRCPPAERDAALAALEHEAGGCPPLDGFRAMRVEQVVALHGRGHEVGSHTVSHPILPALDDAALRTEVVEARRTLSGWLDADVPGFCYPNGDHDDRVAQAVARAGHAYACTTRDGVHRGGDDPYRIRRVAVVPGRVVTGSRGFDPIAFRIALCGLYRDRGRAVASD